MDALAGAVFGPGNTTSKADSGLGSFTSFLDIVEVMIYFSIPARTSTGSRTSRRVMPGNGDDRITVRVTKASMSSETSRAVIQNYRGLF
jgi:hypothetical protein